MPPKSAKEIKAEQKAADDQPQIEGMNIIRLKDGLYNLMNEKGYEPGNHPPALQLVQETLTHMGKADPRYLVIPPEQRDTKHK